MRHGPCFPMGVRAVLACGISKYIEILGQAATGGAAWTGGLHLLQRARHLWREPPFRRAALSGPAARRDPECRACTLASQSRRLLPTTPAVLWRRISAPQRTVGGLGSLKPQLMTSRAPARRRSSPVRARGSAGCSLGLYLCRADHALPALDVLQIHLREAGTRKWSDLSAGLGQPLAHRARGGTRLEHTPLRRGNPQHLREALGDG